MKVIRAAIAASVLMLIGASAQAGVVLHETQTTDRGDGKVEKQDRTVMVQGNQQKTITDRSMVLVDLDKGSMYVMSPARKAYIQMPFPPPGRAGAMMARQMAAMNFKKTGKHDTIAGYPCDEYSGSGSMGGSQYSVVGCFSTAAPGAANFTAFQKAMAAKLPGGSPSSIPDGVPLQVISTAKMTSLNLPGITADQAAKFKDTLAKRPPVVNKTVVTKVGVEDIAAADFTVPAGYQKQEMPASGPTIMSPPQGGGSGGGSMSNMPNTSSPPPASSGSSEGSGDSMAPKLQ